MLRVYIAAVLSCWCISTACASETMHQVEAPPTRTAGCELKNPSPSYVLRLGLPLGGPLFGGLRAGAMDAFVFGDTDTSTAVPLAPPRTKAPCPDVPVS